LTQIAAVILAAGGSTRFGQPKQMLDWNGQPLVCHVADVALAADFNPVIVVLGCQAEQIQPLLGARPVHIATNWRWQEGLSTSVQAGLAALPPDTQAALFLQSDQPLIPPNLLTGLVQRFHQSGALAVFPSYDGQRSSPALFSHKLFAELANVTGDVGGRAVLSRHPHDTATLEVDDPDVLADIDTPDDYEALRVRALADTGRRGTGSVLHRIRHLIVDMDGVLWHGSAPLPGVPELIAFLREQDIGFILATNNSTRTPEQVAEKLAGLGVDVAPELILNSSEATAAYLSTIAPSGTKVYPVGEEGVGKALEKYGFELSEDEADFVVVGWNRDLTWRQLATASLLIYNGAGFIGTNQDTRFPTAQGPVPGNGAQLAALETTTGIKPTVVGKPERAMFQEALHRLGAAPETTAIVGDRLDTDILGGLRAGLAAILVLSGITTADDAAHSAIKPDLICADIVQLVELWRQQIKEMS